MKKTLSLNRLERDKCGVTVHAKYIHAFLGLPSRLILALSLTMLIVYPSPAGAEYDFQIVSPPGAVFAQAFGINNAGKVTGGAEDGVTAFGFEYDIGTGTYTTIGGDLIPIEISNTGVMVGDVNDVCAIRDNNGDITTFFPPSYTDTSICQARGVNSNGQVSGYMVDATDGWLGFIYDSLHGTFEEFLPSLQTITHGINAQRQNAGGVFLFPDEAFPGSPPGRYGYLRQADGSVKYFSISQGFPGQSRARGISESGLVSGFYLDPNTFEFMGYVTTLSGGPEFEEVTLTDDQVVYQKPCNVDLPSPPGPGYILLFTDVFTSQVRNDGVVVGSCSDIYFNDMTGDLIVNNFGFIATPVQ